MNIQFHLTNACNLRCRHCYQGEYDAEIISLLDFDTVLRKTRDFFASIGDPLYSVALTGGEPMCVPGIEDYFLCADAYCGWLVMMSNGILLTSEKLMALRRARHFGAVQVSLEGPKSVNDAIRGQGTYRKIRNAIRLINDAGLRSTVSCTIAPYNYDRVEELYDDLVRYDSPNRLWFDRCIPFKGFGQITKEQFKVFIDSVRRMRERQRREQLPTVPLANRALQWLINEKSAKYYRCGAGIRHFCVMHNGDVMVCRRLDFPVGNLLREDWIDIIKRALPIMKEIHALPSECRGCPKARACNGGLKCLTHAVYGGYDHKDINCFFGE